ncbi:OmpA family protein [Rhizobium chutanense]|nr:OmpA family protein [Rhizobium chutanense]
MTISFLFIIMILLAFFASQFSVSDTVPRTQYQRLQEEKRTLEQELARLKTIEQEKIGLETELKRVQQIVRTPDLKVADAVQQLKDELERLKKIQPTPDAPNQMEVYNNKVAETRRVLLTNLKKEIDGEIPGVNVQVAASFDALQFSGDGLFDFGQDVPTQAGQTRMRRIAEILDRNLGCYSLGPRKTFNGACNPGYALIDALQVEGHTDSRGNDTLNMDLSARRASSIYSLMTQQKPDLVAFYNRNSQPVLSVAGFGKGRPIQSNDTEKGQDANRRIDLRFIMVVPSKEADIATIKSELESP